MKHRHAKRGELDPHQIARASVLPILAAQFKQGIPYSGFSVFHAARPVKMSGRSLARGMPVICETRETRSAGTCESAHCVTALGVTLSSRAIDVPRPRSSASHALNFSLMAPFVAQLKFSASEIFSSTVFNDFGGGAMMGEWPGSRAT